VRHQLRRFAAIGVVATAIDVVVFLVAFGAGLPLGAADVVALASAAAASYGLNRQITFADDPSVRWVARPRAFLGTAVIAGLVDLAVLALLAWLLTPATTPGMAAAKLPAVLVAAAVRMLAYRWVLFGEVRRDIGRRSHRPPAPGEVRLSVVVPAYGEAATVGATLGRIRAEVGDELGPADLELVVVDDGSPDTTAAAAEAAGADQVLVLERNRGKGAAVRAGVLAARGRTVAFTDADLAYPPRQLLRALDEVETGWDMVVGSRRHVETTTLVRAQRLREVGGRVINLLSQTVLLGQYRDTQCGLKAFRSDVARLLFSRGRIDGFAFDVELFHLAERYRLSLTEVAVEVENSERSSVRAARDGLRVVRDLFRIVAGSRRGWYDLSDHDALAPRASQ